jgi:CheY-like chemotaxis protein
MNGPCKWLLVVDDDDDVREVFTIILALRGYHAITARDGRDALDTLQRAPAAPFAIILDLRMPRVDGLEFLRELQKDRRCAQVPVIAVSGDTANMTLAATRGAIVSLRKPVDLEVLMGHVSRLAGDGHQLPA